VFRVQYFFLVVCALLSLSLRVLYNPHSTIAQPNWYFPGLSHPSRQRQREKKKGRDDWTSSDGQSCKGERLCLRLRSKSKSFIMRAAAAAQALFFNISLSCTSFIQTRIHDFPFFSFLYCAFFIYKKANSRKHWDHRLMMQNIFYPSSSYSTDQGRVRQLF
jgi:hypothetical protein